VRRVPCRLAVLGVAVLALIGVSGSASAVSKGERTGDLAPVAAASQRYGHPGGEILVRATVKAGKRASRGSQLGFYLSSDARLDGKDVGLAGRVRVPALKAGRQYNGAGVATIPKTAKVARYYVLACLKTKCHASRQRIELTQDPVTSQSLIEAALKRGEINAATGVLYRAYAAFGDSRLPAKLDGDDISAVGDDSAMREAASAWATLPARIRTKLAPFFRPPLYKGSWARRSVASIPARSTREAGCDSDVLRDKFYVNVPTANGKVRVWWRNGTPHSAKLGSAASMIAKEVNGAIWPKLTKLMGRQPLSDGKVGCFNGEDGRYDIYLYFDESLKGGARALTIAYPGACTHTPAFTVVDVRKGVTRWEIAHELFHAIQFAYSYSADCDDYESLDEATATWAGNYVYPADNVEHEFPRLVLSPGLSLIDARYDGWPFFLYLEKVFSAQALPQIYAKTEQYDPWLAVDAALPEGLDKRWPDFAYYGWNQHPVEPSFTAWDKFDGVPYEQYGTPPPTLVSLNGQRERQLEIPTKKEGFGAEGPLRSLTREYENFSIQGDVEKLEFRNGLVGQQGASVTALVHLKDGTWQRRDWTNKDKVTFCRLNEDEDVVNLVLIFGNSSTYSWSEVPWGSTKLVAQDNCLPEKFTGTFSGAYSSPGNDRWSGTVTFQLKDVEFEVANYDVVVGSVTWQEDPYTSAGCSLTPHSPVTAPLYLPFGGLEIYKDREPMEYTVSLDNTAHYPTMPVDYACEDGSSGTTQQYPPCCAWLYFYGPHYVPDDFQLVGSFVNGAQSFQWNLAPPGD
jgi:hypothetical protein